MFLKALTCAAVALGIVVAPALAEQLVGQLTRVDVAGKKFFVISEKDQSKEVEVTITDATIFVTSKGEKGELDLDLVKKGVEQSKGKEAVRVRVIHKKRVASKIRFLNNPIGDTVGGPWDGPQPDPWAPKPKKK